MNLLLLKLHIILSIIYISISLKCTEGNFTEILSNSLIKIILGPENEACLKYFFKSDKNLIGINFESANLSYAKAYIYKSQSDISFKDDEYQNAFDSFSVAEYPFKEINVTEFNDSFYIIIRETKDYNINDYITLYDSEEFIELKDGEPINIKNFMSNLEYKFIFSSEKKIDFYFNSKVLGNKFVKYEKEDNDSKQILDEEGIHFEFLPKDIGNNTVKFYVSQNNETQDQEFSLIVYESKSSKNNVEKLSKNELLKKNYIYFDKINDTNEFYFYADVSDYINSGTVNLKLDYKSIESTYINITSDIVISKKQLNNEDFASYFINIENESKLPMKYENDSDEYKKIYFHNNEENVYKYVIVFVKINKFIYYLQPKSFIISIGEQTNVKNLSNIEYFSGESFNIEIKPNFPSYLKLSLDGKSKYLFYAQNKKNVLFINGDLIKDNNEINEDYLIDEKDIIVLTGINDLTLSLFNNTNDTYTFYIEKISDDVIIIENDRTENVLTITMNDEDCFYKKKKYIFGTYNKDIYSSKLASIYATTDFNNDFNLYFKNSTFLDNNSLFPSSDIYKKELNKIIIQNSNFDFFTITCNEPGNLYIRPLKNIFDEKTHLILQNSINNIKLLNNTEILQLTTLIKNNHEPLYLSILSNDGNELTITPLTEELFEKKTIKNNELFIQKIDTDLYNIDQLAIKISTNNTTDIEVIEVIHQNYTKYTIINDTKKNEITTNNFVSFFDKNISSIKLSVEGLENETIYYGIVKLSTNDINLLPPAQSFKNNIETKKIYNNEIIEIKNNNYQKDDDKKQYLALIFSIYTTKTDKKYYIQIGSDKIPTEEDDLFLNILLAIVIISVIIIGIITFICIKRKTGINVENLDNNSNEANQPLYPAIDGFEEP